jgi:mono/diheme cytochrome c family protein
MRKPNTNAPRSRPLTSMLAGLLVSLTATNAPPLMAADGAAAWVKTYAQTDGSPARSCASCHTADLTQPGNHAKTGKRIEPLAPSINPQRLTDPNKVEKWLLRNCRWTLGRECSTAEKAEFISYIKSQ